MQFIEPLFETGRIGWTMLGIAAMLLVLAVIVAARLRWTQSRPLAACVVLSVFAHILLVCSAYLTRIFDVPTPPGEVAISIQFTDESPVPAPHQSQVVSDQPVPSPTPLSTEEAPPLPNPAVAKNADDSNQSSDFEPFKLFDPAEPAESAVDADSMVVEPDEPATEALDLSAMLNETKDQLTESPDPDASVDAAADEPLPLFNDSQPQIVVNENATVSEESRDQSLKTSVPNPPVATSSPTPALDRIPETRTFIPIQPNPLRENVVEQAESAWRSATPSVDSAASVEPTNQPLQKIPTRYQNRIAEDRAKVTRRRGGNPNTDAAVRHALRWLAENQSRDGRWIAAQHGAGQGRLVEGHFRGPAGIQADTGITGLALLAFLGDGHTHKSGRHREVVAKGLEYLLREQASDGSLFGPSTNFARMYCHGIASMALNEAYAMTSDQRLLPYVEQAVRYSLAAQSPATGGWRYHPGDDGDTSQFGWQVMALLAAEQGGVPIPAGAKSGMERFLRSVSVGGLAGYRAGYAASRPMTAEAMACRIFLDGGQAGAAAINRETLEAANYLRGELPGYGQPNYYYWYYATLALAQSGSEQWPAWNKALQMQLLRTQSATGAASGSWEPNSVWGGHGGRVYSTALATMCLEVYYRY